MSFQGAYSRSFRVSCLASVSRRAALAEIRSAKRRSFDLPNVVRLCDQAASRGWILAKSSSNATAASQRSTARCAFSQSSGVLPNSRERRSAIDLCYLRMGSGLSQREEDLVEWV